MYQTKQTSLLVVDVEYLPDASKGRAEIYLIFIFLNVVTCKKILTFCGTYKSDDEKKETEEQQCFHDTGEHKESKRNCVWPRQLFDVLLAAISVLYPSRNCTFHHRPH